MVDTHVILGDFTFSNYEVPEQINFGGSQAFERQTLLGGARVLDATGPDDDALCWGGRMQGPNAQERARHLDFLRKLGNPLTLSWDTFIYLVVIKSFKAQYQRFYQVLYTIECEVLVDLTAPVETTPPPSVDKLIAADMANCTGILGTIQAGAASVAAMAKSVTSTIASVVNQYQAAVGTVTSTLNTLSTAVSAAGALTGAPPKVIASVVSPLTAAQNGVSNALAVGGKVVGFSSLSSGIATSAGGTATAFNGMQATMAQLGGLTQINGSLGRMALNLKGTG